MRVNFLLPVVSQPRYYKRIRALEKLGVSSEIFAFERDYFRGNFQPDEYESLGNLKHGHYHKRLAPVLKALFRVRAMAGDTDVIYAFGLDMLLLAYSATCRLGAAPKIVYEVGDIRGVLLGRRFVSRLLRWLERRLLRRASLLVVTSEAYISGYYHGIQGLRRLRYRVVENKLDENAPPPSAGAPACTDAGALRIGYFGLIRCRRSWEIMKEVSKQADGRIQVYVWGISMGLGDLDEQTRALSHIDYRGPYVSPEDLPRMYGQVDIVWACYPYQGTEAGNWRWARTNRFYEACLFHRPMFAQVGTEDGRVVEALELGRCLDLSDVSGTVAAILGVSDQDLVRWRQNIGRLPKETYVYTDEHAQLLEKIRETNAP